jgi:hypothetical protein
MLYNEKLTMIKGSVLGDTSTFKGLDTDMYPPKERKLH